MSLLLILILTGYIPFTKTEKFPKPRLIIAGMTHSGKSTMANVLLGADPLCQNCTYKVCSAETMNSCTNETKVGKGNWLREGIEVTVVDTPGFGDSNGRDTIHIEEMMKVLNTEVESANAIMLLIKGNTNVFKAGLTTMVREMTMLFGESMWNYVIIGVSFWKYDQYNIDKRDKGCSKPDRPDLCHNEDWFTKEINRQLREKVHLTKDLPAVFLDSWSQTSDEIDDPTQQLYFKQESNKLHDFMMSSKDGFAFRTINDVLKENTDLHEKVDSLNNIIDFDLTELQQQIRSVNDELDESKRQIRSHMKTHYASKEELNREKISIKSLASNTSILEKDLATKVVPPVGSIIAWTDRVNRKDASIIPLPSGWVYCDGRRVHDTASIFNMKQVPDLNGEGRFLRGTSSNNVLTKQDHMIKDMVVEDKYYLQTFSGHCENYGDRTTSTFGMQQKNPKDDHMCKHDFWLSHRNSYTGEETRPKNMGVIYIIRIK